MTCSPTHYPIGARRPVLHTLAALAAVGLTSHAAAVTLADQPVFASSEVPGNLALALSVEWPTASRTAHVGNYSSATEYLGYFDPRKCYLYQVNATANSTNTGDTSYFYPQGLAVNHACTGDNDSKWSGNFLNWASTATIDPFRWAMTGGRRVVDTASETILEKAWHSGQGLFPDRDLTVSEIAGATPFNGTRVGVQINNLGFKMRLNVEGDLVRPFNASYYNGKNPGSGTPVRVVTNDDAYHDWGDGSPGGNVNRDSFSVRMVGTFTAPSTGNYRFRTVSDDGIRVWVDTSGQSNFGSAIIDNWDDHGSETDTTGDVYLTAGQRFSVRIDYYESSGGAVMQFLWRQPGGSYTAFSGGSGTREYTMRVKVCDPSTAAGGLEGNCKQYGSNYKPEGLIQKYSDRIRFSAFGYLNDASDQRDGAVLRARQKFVGPLTPVPRQAAVSNPNAEWSSVDGTFVQNPDSVDATNTQTATGVTVSYSGVMNYLNQFGQLIPGDYKNYDPVSELFYAVMRYYRNLGNVASWSSMGTNTSDATKQRWVDGFPVIANWGDPIQHSCQRNFVLGIGDIYTHVDKDVAGNTSYRDREPTMPSEVAADNTVNAITATNKVGALQGLGNIGSSNSYSGRANSAYIAGLAYDANTTDIRPDNATQANTIGKQTVQTYWVDVLEQSFVANNQFYLAAKFGGMNVPADFNPYADTTVANTIQKAWWSTTGETVTDVRTNTTQDRPDNYFAAGQPDTLIAGLTKAFASIANAIKAYTTSFSLSSAQVSGTNTAAYASQYDSRDWSGVLTARRLSFAADGTPSTTDVWSSTATLGNQLRDAGWDTGRRVVSWSGTAGVAFRSGNGGLSSEQLATLDTSYRTGDDSVDYLNYLRGDRTNEGAGKYRARTVLLGDIVNAKVTPVGPPQAAYSDAFNAGYSAFKTTWKNRPTMVYVGANDGMLHAFDGALDGTSAGLERFAYVPSELLRTTDGLAELGNPQYEHRYYVDATPLVFDVDFNNAGGDFTTNSTGSNAAWRSILVGGLGKGGKSFYAIDVTDPATFTTESIAASRVLWEFKDADTSGYSFGQPTAVKTKKYGWVIVLTSGYNGPNADQQGYLYFVHPKTGALLEKVGTGVAAPGLAQATAYVQNYADYTADAIYVGDLNGKLWRFNVTQARGTTDPYPTATHFATLTDGGTTPRAQPVTIAPLVEISPQSFRRFVLVGTGQLLSTADINSSAVQSFYAILDGTAGAFSAVTSPITRADLVQNTDLTLGVGALGTAKGWYMDLGTTDGTAWRVVTPTASYNGTLLVSSLLTVGDACKPSGQSRIYYFNYTTGKTELDPATANGPRQRYVQATSAVTDLVFVRYGSTGADGTSSPGGGNTVAIGGGSGGETTKIGDGVDNNTVIRRLNWREVPTIE